MITYKHDQTCKLIAWGGWGWCFFVYLFSKAADTPTVWLPQVLVPRKSCYNLHPSCLVDLTCLDQSCQTGSPLADSLGFSAISLLFLRMGIHSVRVFLTWRSTQSILKVRIGFGEKPGKQRWEVFFSEIVAPMMSDPVLVCNSTYNVYIYIMYPTIGLKQSLAERQHS